MSSADDDAAGAGEAAKQGAAELLGGEVREGGSVALGAVPRVRRLIG
jgi:hypothetical protein